jgi:predicted nuclease of predicted toxin-antitoxin system
MPDLKFLLDADMPRSTGELIKSLGYDIEDVRDIGMRAAKDQDIIDYAIKTNRIIVTRDTDFGEVLRYPDRPGAIVLRFPYMFTAKELNRVDKGCSDRGIGAVQEKADLIL